jgi:uncharacterized protein DUF6912
MIFKTDQRSIADSAAVRLPHRGTCLEEQMSGGAPAETTMRVYLPATLPVLAGLARDGSLGPAPLTAHAITPGLREWYSEGDEEELEYVAFVRAAQRALELLHADPAAPRRRAVVSADVPAAQLTPLTGDLGDSRVRLAAPVPLAAVAAVHCDATAAAEVIAAAAAAAPAAAAGDADAQFAVDTAEDEDLEWYDVTELPHLVAG